MKNFTKVKFISALLVAVTLISLFVGCNSNQESTKTPDEKTTQNVIDTSEEPTDISTEAHTYNSTEETTEMITTDGTSETVTKPLAEDTTEATADPEAQSPTEEPTAEETVETQAKDLPYDIYKEDLIDEMDLIFTGTKVMNETVMFLDYGDSKALLFKPDKIISVRSYSGEITYTEDVDYKLENGRITILEGSSIPCITRAVFYNDELNQDTLRTMYNGKATNTYYGEETTVTSWQVNITYTHSDEWKGFEQESKIDVYKSFLDKLANGEDVTVVFYGDSITRGSNSSFYVNTKPKLPGYALLFTYSLADLFDYKVEHVYTFMNKTFGSDSGKAHELITDYVAGDRGTIRFINASVGGWTSSDAVDNVASYVTDFTSEYGCDLFLYAFGMNDPGTAKKVFQSNITKVVDTVLEKHPKAAIMLVSTMLPNPNALGNWYGNQQYLEEPMIKCAKIYTQKNVPCAVACVNSICKDLLDLKSYHDFSSNNINHPNDFFHRVYAQTLLQTLIGYENMK